MQQKMAEYKMSAPEVSWVEIEQAVGTGGRRAMAIPMWRRRIVAAVMLLVVVGAGFWMQRHGKEADESQQKKPAGTALEATKTHQQPISAKTTYEPATYASAMPRVRSTAMPVQPESDERTEDQAQTEEKKQSENSTHAPERQVQTTTATYTPESTDRPQFRATKNRLTAKVYLGNSINSYTGSAVFTPMLMSAEPFGKYDDNMGDEGESPLHSITTSIRHHQSLRFGLSLRYGIGNRWSIESGLSYSYHKSDITNLSGDSEMTTEQRLSYIGIPLNVSYQIWSGNRFGFYLSAGGMAEKMVKGSRTTQTATESVSIRPLQFSVNGVAGAEFRIDKSFSLYVEPGLSYHFDNNSPVPTIYQDEPLNFNLNVGLRFSF